MCVLWTVPDVIGATLLALALLGMGAGLLMFKIGQWLDRRSKGAK